MDLGIKGRTAVVLAASKGIGRGCAEALADEGARLAICSRDATALQRAVAELGRRTEVFAASCDVTDEASTRGFLSAARAKFGAIDILVNNCGGPSPGSFADGLGREAWQQAFERSLYQVVRWTQAVAPEMVGRKWGRIVNIVSTSVKQPIDGLLLSNSVRPGVIGFTKSVSRELAPHGVTLNCVLPGSILSDRTQELAEARSKAEGVSVEEWIRRKAAEVPAGRLGQPREIGDAVAFLCSRQAAYITGIALAVDGGLLRANP
jgi:3-oxoacyl-[acyl-carrier protein] reductase